MDVYDALTSARPYKDAMPHERAMSILVEGRGTHFDPGLLDLFLTLEDAVLAVKHEGRGQRACA